MEKENLPSYDDLNLYDGVIEYKGSFLNGIILNERFPKTVAYSWNEWKAARSNRLLITYVHAERPPHLLALFRKFYAAYCNDLDYPLFIFALAGSGKGETLMAKIGFKKTGQSSWRCARFTKRQFATLCAVREKC